VYAPVKASSTIWRLPVNITLLPPPDQRPL
jgi:hypothetical protein